MPLVILGISIITFVFGFICGESRIEPIARQEGFDEGFREGLVCSHDR